jgi:hypothetical protein
VSFFWYQLTGGKEKWTLAPAEQRQKIISDLHPVLVTVLDAKSIPQDDWTREQYLSMKYSGPLYFDWDSRDDLPKAISDMQRTVAKLVDEFKVPPEAMSIYATGGKGFHLEIPMEVFTTGNAIKTGVTLLPLVYRHMALEVVTPTLDMRVYSTRKGRHWRVPNIRRDNGKFKVQISYAEAMTMDQEAYDLLTSEQRPLTPPSTSHQSAELLALFLESRAKVEGETKRALKAKDETKELNRFNGEIPASAKLLMAGMHIRQDVGFNNIALQFAILAHALGKSEEEFLQACEGIINEYTSDGRYNSPRKRREALQERFYYTKDNPCYIFSFGGLKSIAEEGFEPDELRPGRELVLVQGEVKADDEALKRALNPDGTIKSISDWMELADTGLSDEALVAMRQADRRDNHGVVVNHHGIYVAQGKDEMLTRVSPTGFSMPWTLLDVATKKEVGMQVNLFLEKGSKVVNYGRHEIPIDTFASRASLDRYLSGYGSGFTGTDIQATCVRMALKDQAARDDNTAYVLTREGVDVITDPDTPEDASRILVFVSRKGVVLGRDVPDDPYAALSRNERFMFRPRATNTAVYDPDNIDLKPLDPREGSHVRKMLKSMLEFNADDYVVANTVGWFVSSFHRQVHHRIHGQFPILQIYGPAGSGKTSTPTYLSRMFWVKDEPKVHSATRGGLTQHARRTLYSGSASVPMLMDEFKRTEMGETEYSKLVGELRTAYNSGTMMLGGIKDGSAMSDFRTITELERSAPICTMSETLIDETAVMERCVVVPMQPSNQRVATWEFLNTEENRILLGRLGTLILWHTLRWTMDDYAKLYKESKDHVKAFAAARPDLRINERPLANMAVVVCGLKFLRATLNRVGVTELDQRLESLCSSILNEEAVRRVGAPKAEIYKALSDVAWITHNEEEDSPYAIREGNEYCYYIDDTGSAYLDLDVRSVYVKYQSWCKAKHQQSHYANVDGFANALLQIPAAMSRTSPNSPLRRGAAGLIFRFRFEEIWAEDVEHFKGKLIDGNGRIGRPLQAA